MKDAKDEIRAETMRIIKNRIERVEDKMREMNVDAQTACSLLGVKYNGYKRDKKIIGEPIQPPRPSLITEEPMTEEAMKEPAHIEAPIPLEETKTKKHRVSIDLPEYIHRYIKSESERTTINVKMIVQHLVIKDVDDAMKKGADLI